MPVYKRDETSWRVVIWHKGQRRDWIVEGQKRDAEVFEAEKRLEVQQSDPSEMRAVPKFGVFCAERYTPHAKLRLKGSTLRNRQYVLEELMLVLEDKRLDEITPVVAESYCHARRKHVRASTVNSELRALRRILNYARELGIRIPEPRFSDLPERRGDRKAIAWTPEQVAALFIACHALHADIMPLVVFLANTGCRKGEAIALRWDCVDFRRRVIAIEPNNEWQPKDGEPRQVPMNDELHRWLRSRIQAGGYVFPTSAGGRYAFWPQRKFDACREAAKLKGGPHSLRHTFATQWIQNGGSWAKLAEVMGHSEQHVTKLYRHLLPGHLDADRNRVSFAPTVGPAEAEAQKRWRS